MRMTDFYKKTTNYWQAVIRVGVPMIVMYRVIHYLTFLIAGDSSVGRYPWRFAAVIDPIMILLLSTVWWSLMRSGFGKPSSTDPSTEMRHDKSARG